MANNTYAFGLTPIGDVANGRMGGIRAYYMPATYATDAFIGDLVVSTNSANATAINGHKAGSLDTVVKYAAEGTAVTGVIVGFEPIDEYKSIGAQGAASTERIVYVCDDPKALFAIRADADSITSAIIGKNVDVTVGAGNAFTGRSTTVADTSTAATTATLPLKIVGIVQQEGEDEVAGSAMLKVMLNTSTLANHTAGI